MNTSKKKRKFFALIGITLALPIVTGAAIYRFGLGKSANFYLASGFRMPHGAKVVVSGQDYASKWSNEGEKFWVFKVDAQTAKSYLSHSPWGGVPWRTGPVPDDISIGCANLGKRYYDIIKSSRVRYLAQSKEPLDPFHDGRIIIVDPTQNMIYYSEWNY